MTTEAIFGSRRARRWAGLALALAVAAAYGNSFRGAFVFDDVTGIEENATIRHLSRALFPPLGALTVSGRPLLNLSLALNYAVSGSQVWSYHAVNLLIHVLATLTLFGLVRRTLERMAPAGQPADSGRATWLALAVALLWGLHPLQTESVTYLVQRAESMMGLFYLLTLYCFLRYAAKQSAFAGASADEEAGGEIWAGLSIGCCLLGMATKEVMVSAPLIVLLYDRAFLAGSFGEAWRRRRMVYAGLAATWALLGALVVLNGDHAGTAGFSVGPGAVAYWLTQFPAVVRYLGLAVWPHPLVLDYGMQWVRSVPAVAPFILIVGLLVAGTVVALARNSALGFLGACFFALLAPTSVVPGTQQTMAEHRMYLPLAAVAVLGMAGLGSLVGRRPSWRNPCLAFLAAVAVAFGLATARRNATYRSDLAMWADTAAKRPQLALAHHNLGRAYFERGDFAEAETQYREALRLNPDSVYGHINLGLTLEQLGLLPAALDQYREALRLQPGWAGVHGSLAGGLIRAGQLPEAMAQYRQALRIKPDFPQAENGLGLALFRSGDAAGAIGHFQAALRLDPGYAEVDNSLGVALAGMNRLPEAIASFQRALRINPGYVEAHLNLGNTFYQAGRTNDAIHEYESALRLKPGSAEVRDHYGILLAGAGRLAEAAAQFQEALRLQPGDRQAEADLGRLQGRDRAASGR